MEGGHGRPRRRKHRLGLLGKCLCLRLRTCQGMQASPVVTRNQDFSRDYLCVSGFGEDDDRFHRKSRASFDRKPIDRVAHLGCRQQIETAQSRSVIRGQRKKAWNRAVPSRPNPRQRSRTQAAAASSRTISRARTSTAARERLVFASSPLPMKVHATLSPSQAACVAAA